MTTEDELFHAIFGQESTFGQNAKTSSRDAHGPMQITPGTFAEYAKPGERLDNYDDNLAVGHRIIHDLYTRYGGDPGRVAVGYFSGKGNVAPMAFNTPYKVDSNDGTTKTSEYVNGILKRLGTPGTSTATTKTNATTTLPASATQTPQTPAPADPWAQTRSALGQALSSISTGESVSAGGGSRVIDPVYSPGAPSQALMENFAAPPANPVPAKFAGGALAPQLGSLAMTPQTPSYVDPSITQGAPSMTAMVQAGFPNDPTMIDPRRTGAITPYPRAFSRLG